MIQSVYGIAAQPVGEPSDYTGRPGFAHDGAGVAACWYGGARGAGRTLLAAAAERDLGPHALAHLGAVDIALHTARAALEAAAADIDADPCDLQKGSRRRARIDRPGTAEETWATWAALKHLPAANPPTGGFRGSEPARSGYRGAFHQRPGGPVSMTTPVTLPAAYFDAMYRAADDPWGFEDRWYEQRNGWRARHAASVTCCARWPDDRAAVEKCSSASHG